MIYPFLFEDRQEDCPVGHLRGLPVKIAMVMAMFTQAFRFAYEPFVVWQEQGEGQQKMYAAANEIFIIFSLLAFLAVMFYLDFLRCLVARGGQGAGCSSYCDVCRNVYGNLFQPFFLV